MTPDHATDVNRPAEGGDADAGERRSQLERELEAARATLWERDFQLASTRKTLARSEPLLDSWRGIARRQEQELMDGESQLIEAELRAERLEETLASMRSGRAYRLMRIMWRLRRPFKRG